MDQDVSIALAQLRYQLAEIRTGLGATTPDDAEGKVADAIAAMRDHERRLLAAEELLRKLAQWAVAHGFGG